MGKKKNKAAKPANAEEVTEKLQTPTENKDPMKDPKVIAVLEELEKLKKFNSAYEQGIALTKRHISECKNQTGEILIADVDYCLALAKRMAEFKSK